MTINKYFMPTQMFHGKIKNHEELKNIIVPLIESDNGVRKFSQGESIFKTDYDHVLMEKKWRDIFFSHISSYMEQVRKELKAESWKISAAWYQWYEEGDFHGKHTHGNSSFTNVYFLELPHKSSKTTIYADSGDTVIDLPEISEGDVITFPSGCVHESLPNKHKNRKLVIAFNCDFYEFVEDDRPQVQGSFEESDPKSVFNKRGYSVVHGLISTEEARIYTKRLEDAEKNFDIVNVPDNLCPTTKNTYGYFDDLLEKLTNRVSDLVGKKLYPTYSYARLYSEGDELPIHHDRPACEYSLTLSLGRSGDMWPIYMAASTDESTGEFYEGINCSGYMKTPADPIYLDVGDAALYRGPEIIHWRKPLPDGWQAQVFLHWVDAEGPYAHLKYDGREHLNKIQDTQDEAPQIEEVKSSPEWKQSVSSGILEVVVDNDSRGFGEGGF